MALAPQTHSLSKMILCRSHCDHCGKTIRFFGLRCRFCRTKFHKNCSHSSCTNCFPTNERKSKTGFFRRSFSDHRKKRCKSHEPFGSSNQSKHTSPMKWKLGQPNVHTNSERQFSFSAVTTNSGLSPTSPSTRSAFSGHCRGSSPTELNLYEFENLRNTWHLAVNNPPFIGNSPCRAQVALSSGYSSVNQSCSSSSASGSQRSRSPTPDQFETVREEQTSRFGERLLSCDALGATQAKPGHLNARNVADDIANGNRTEKLSLKETPFFFLESDEESSGEWDERENCGRIKPRPGLRRVLRELEIRYSDVEIDEKVGVGPNGPVYRGRWHGEVMVHTRQTSKQVEVEEFRKEVAILSMIRHENVMLFMGACLEPPNLAVVTSLRKCISIHNYLHCQESRLSMASRLNVMLQVAQGMSYLHAKYITVPCLRTMNIYMESKVKLCINDYTYLHHQVKRYGYSSVPQGHLTYLAPEVISRVNVDVSTGRIVDTTIRNRAMDVYAFGTVMYEILTDKWPFANLCPETVIWMIGKGLPQSLAKVKGPDSVKDLIKSCWSLDPSKRPSFVKITQILKQNNIPTNYIPRRHSISEPEKMQYIGKPADLCHLKRI